MIKGVGVDVLEIKRIEQAFVRSGRFGARVFTTGELDYCQQHKRRWASLAARFAAKEAVSKALGTGIGPVRWTDIEVIGNAAGAPEVKLHNAAFSWAQNLGVRHLALSMSHSEEFAIAFVIAY